MCEGYQAPYHHSQRLSLPIHGVAVAILKEEKQVLELAGHSAALCEGAAHPPAGCSGSTVRDFERTTAAGTTSHRESLVMTALTICTLVLITTNHLGRYDLKSVKITAQRGSLIRSPGGVSALR